MSAKRPSRPALAADPFDAVLGARPTRRAASTPPAAAPEPTSAGRVRVTVTLPPELLERLRDVVWQLSGPPQQLTLAGVVERAIVAEVERLEGEHNRGRRFPPRSGALRQGRPLSR